MKKNLHRFTIGIMVLVFLLSACQGTVPAETTVQVAETKPEPVEPTVVPTATEAPPETVHQWAVSARADGEPLTADPNWGHATGALGEPDVTDCAEPEDTAWTVGDQEGLATLEVFYEEAVVPSEVNIVENFGGNQVVKVELLDVDGNYHEAPIEAAKKQFKCIYTLKALVEDADYEAAGVRITVDPSTTRDWQQIDAVELVGISTGNVVEVPELQEFVEPPPIGERAYYDRPDDNPKTYQVHVIYLLASDHRDRERDLNGQIAKSVQLANEWMAEQTGNQSINFDTYQGELDITFVQMQATESEINTKTVEDLGHLDWRSTYIAEYMKEFQDLVKQKPGKLYIIFTEFEQNQTFWGASTGTGFMFLYPRLWKEVQPASQDYAYAFEFLFLHELIHEFGFVQECATNFNGNNGGHTKGDNSDLMWVPKGENYYTEYYQDYGNMTLDPGNDDYFNHNIKDCPDLADSAFMTPVSENPYVPEWGWWAGNIELK